MKQTLFENMGQDYPIHLEQDFGHVLRKIVALWDDPGIHDYLSELMLDKRGGRKGFPPEASMEIIAIREFRMLETFRQAERKEDAIRVLKQRGIAINQGCFLRALEDGDQETVDLFVRANFNIHFTNGDGTPPLLMVLKKGYTIVAKILLNAGADVNEKDKLGLTPLLVTCGKSTKGYKEIAEILVKKGAMINVRDTLGFTPLLLSLSGGTVDIASLLIEKGADVLACTRKGETALTLARKLDTAQSADIVELLISKGATH